jgi:hypothetical protein
MEIASLNTVNLTQTSLIGHLEGSYLNKTQGESLMGTVKLTRPTVIDLFGVFFIAGHLHVISSWNTLKLTR